MDTIGSIRDPTVRIVPLDKFKEYISKLEYQDDMPVTLGRFFPKRIKKVEVKKYYDDHEFPEDVARELQQIVDVSEDEEENKMEKYLTVDDLKWLHEHLKKVNYESNTVYLHELLEDSKILLPDNEIIKRNSKLEARCERLRQAQINREYRAMTKNVDNVRAKQPEDTIAYQLKNLNKQLIAVFQFVLSVAAGFLFGFLGIELIFGNLDFGFRLLMGIICALVIALAEIYFLAKKLNEDTVVDESVQLGGPMAFGTKPHSD